MKEEQEKGGVKRRSKGEGGGGWQPRWDGHYLMDEGIQEQQMK